MEIPLINIQDVIDYADLSVNIKERKFNQYILMAQDRFLVDVIGAELLALLVERKCANALTPDDYLLLTYIKPYLVNYSYSLYVGSSMKLSLNSGVATLQGDNATVIGQQARITESKRYVLSALKQAEKIVIFLDANNDLYPLYIKGKCKTNYSQYFGL